MFAVTRQPFADVGGRSDPLPSEPEFTAEGWVAAAEGTYSFDVPGRLPIEFSLPGKTRDATRRTVRGFFGRIFQVSHLYLLKLATGATVTDFETILEFGAGTGEGADVAARLGFRGAYVLYDLPQMVLLQRYWLRLAGRPSYIVGHEVAPSALAQLPGRLRGRAALVSSLHTARLSPGALNELRLASHTGIFVVAPCAPAPS